MSEGIERPDRSAGIAVAVGLGCLHFCVLAAWYVLRPLRDEIATLDPDQVPVLWTWVFAVMLVLSPSFGWLAGRLSRRTLLLGLFGAFSAAVLGFAAFFAGASGSGRETGEAVFYVFLSVLNLFVVSAAWSFTADLLSAERARAWFGPIAAAGTLGGMAGSWAVGSLRGSMEPEQLLVLAGVLLALGAPWVLVLDRGARRRARAGAAPSPVANSGSPGGPEGGPLGGSLWRALGSLVTSPYVAGIAGYMALTNVAGTVFYLQQSELLREHLAERSARGVFLADVNLWSNGLALLGQLFLNAWVLRRLGVGRALLALPAVVFLALAALAWVQSAGASPALVLGTFAVAEVVRRGANFALARPTREYLFTLVSRAERYQTKNFMDTAGYRGVDVLASSTERALRAATGWGSTQIALSFLPLVAGWCALAVFLGQRARSRAAQGKPAG